MAESKPYVVRSGDYLTALACERGTTVGAILADPNNAGLKKRRAHPEILLPGDVVFLPERKAQWLAVDVGSVNTFVGTPEEVEVRLTLHGTDGKPLANATVTTTPELGSAPLSTDGSGALKLRVPIDVRTVRIAVTGGGPVFEVKVGNLDPHDEPSGLLSRLRQLGYVGHEAEHVRARQWLSRAVGGLDALALRAGIEAYQAANNKDVTGESDDALCASVRADHGS